MFMIPFVYIYYSTTLTFVHSLMAFKAANSGLMERWWVDEAADGVSLLEQL